MPARSMFSGEAMFSDDEDMVSDRPTFRYRGSVNTPFPAGAEVDTMGPDGDPMGPAFLTVPAPPPLPREMNGGVFVPPVLAAMRPRPTARRMRAHRTSVAIALCGAILFGVAAASVVAPNISASVAHDGAPADAPSVASTEPARGPESEEVSPALEAVVAPTPAPATEVAAIAPVLFEAPRAVTRSSRAARARESAELTARMRDESPPPAPAAPRREGPSMPAAQFGGLRALRSTPQERSEGEVGERAVAVRRAVRPNVGPLDPQAVRRVISLQQGRLRQCYTTAIRRLGTPMDAHVQLTVEIHPEGYVSDVLLGGTDLPFMNRCLENSARRWRFPASSDGGRVPLPLTFTVAP